MGTVVVVRPTRSVATIMRADAIKQASVKKKVTAERGDVSRL